jgi:hypothetical protein
MNHPTYSVEFDPLKKQYSFRSTGRKGTIIKVVEFVEIQANVYNLGFGDFNPITQEIDDTIATKNGDMHKVLATIISITIDFLSDKPLAYVLFEGSTESRTRLYQIAIHQYYDEFIRVFEIYGSDGGPFELFDKNKKYESFLIQKLL